MAYSAILGDSQQLAIANLRMQTQISLTTTSPGQQQSQSSSFSTGKWTAEPKLFQVDRGFVLEIESEQNSFYVLIQQNSVSTIQAPANLNNCPQVDLTEVSDSNPEPMQPMQPMKMGNMSMDINSMSMQMGNMSMSLDNESKTTPKQFCSQCGTEAKAGDRFCRSCGHELDK